MLFGEGSFLVSYLSYYFKFMDGELYGVFLLNWLSMLLLFDIGIFVGSVVDILIGKFIGFILFIVFCFGFFCINN